MIEQYKNRIFRGDCVEQMAQLPTESIDLIFADPPYNLQLQKTLLRPEGSAVAAVNDQWDQFDDFASYDQFTTNWLKEAKRLLKPNGTIWVIGSYHNIYRVGKILQDLGFWILNDICWCKLNPMPNFRGRRFTNAHETLLWCTKKSSVKNYTFNYQTLKTMNHGKQMRSDWLFSICNGNERLKDSSGTKIHSTQKPEALLYRIITASSNQGDLVLDPFLGTGTTAAVAKKLGRDYVGIELSADYIKAAEARIAKVEPTAEPYLAKAAERKGGQRKISLLLEEGILNPGEPIYSADRSYQASLARDGRLLYNHVYFSPEDLIKLVTNQPEELDPWNFWHCLRDKKLVALADLEHPSELEGLDP